MEGPSLSQKARFSAPLPRIALLGFGIILILGVIVRLAYISTPMGHDEATTFLLFVSRPWYHGISYYLTTNNHVFHTLLAHISYVLFGNEPAIIRLPAFIAGVLVVIMTFKVARDWYSWRVALIAAALTASSAQLIAYSVEARGYTIGTLLFLILIFLSPVVSEGRNRFVGLLYALTGALALWTVPTMVYGVAIAVVWVFVLIMRTQYGIERRTSLLKLLFACFVMGMLTLLLYLPLLIESGPERLFANRYIEPIGWRQTLQGIPGLVAGVWQAWHIVLPGPLALVFFLAFLYGATIQHRVSRFPVSLAVIVVVVVLPLLIVQRVLPFSRIWLFLLPIFYIMTAAGIDKLFSRFIASTKQFTRIISISAVTLTLILILILVNSGWVVSRISMRSASEIVEFLEPRLVSGNYTLASPLHRTLRYYFVKNGLPPDDVGGEIPAEATAVYLVVEYYQSPEDVLQEGGAATGEFTDPTLIQTFEDASLYQVVRRGS